MRKWRVWVPQWEEEFEAEDEGDALTQADSRYSFMNEVRAEEIEEGEDAGRPTVETK